MDALTPAGSTPLLVGAWTTPLKQIAHPKGDIYHGLTRLDADFAGFGEAYFSTVTHGATKGWKRHTFMVMNLVVPVGRVRFHLHDESSGTTRTVVLGPDHYHRLTVQPGVWMAFSGVGDGLNLVLNLASIPHDPGEATTRELEALPLQDTPS